MTWSAALHSAVERACRPLRLDPSATWGRYRVVRVVLRYDFRPGELAFSEALVEEAGGAERLGAAREIARDYKGRQDEAGRFPERVLVARLDRTTNPIVWEAE